MANVKKRVFLITLLILLLLCLISPALYSLTWHLRHGNRIVFNEKEVQVPRGWVARREARSLAFIKYPVLVFGLRDATSGFTLWPGLNNASQDPEDLYKSWISVNWSMWNGSDTVVKGPFTFGSRGKEIDCMTSFSNTGSDGMASCLLFQRTWLAQFTGNKKDVESFFEVVRGLSTVEENSSGKP